MNSNSGKIGFIGIGAMGAPMAGNLAAAGFKLVINDADASRTAKFTASHAAEVAANLAELGKACDVVITMLPDGKIVRKVLCGDGDSFKDCVAAGMKQGSIVIDMSSSSPVGTRELGGVLAKRGIALIDAPVSGGVKRAVDASLAIMAGGDAALFERCKPIFGKLGKQLFHAGPLGAGHAVKALNNYVSAAGLIAACEAVVAGSRFGLKAETIIDILNASSGMNNSSQNKFRQFILPRTWGAGFTMSLMAKDLRTALEVTAATGTADGLARHCVEIWNAAERKLGGSSDHTEIYRHIEAGRNAPAQEK